MEYLVFTDASGRPFDRRRYGDIWRKATGEASLPDTVTFHDLRHFFAGMMMTRRQNPKAIQRWLGHCSITETFDTYGHLWPDDADSGRAVVDGILSFLRTGTAA